MSIVKIKRSTTTLTPATLVDGELAYSHLSGNLFIGNGASVVKIGGATSTARVDAIAAVIGLVKSNGSGSFSAAVAGTDFEAAGAVAAHNSAYSHVNIHTHTNFTALNAVSGTNTGDQTNITGNAGTATKLQTARTINGVAFDGTANITITAGGTGHTLDDSEYNWFFGNLPGQSAPIPYTINRYLSVSSTGPYGTKTVGILDALLTVTGNIGGWGSPVCYINGNSFDWSFGDRLKILVTDGQPMLIKSSMPLQTPGTPIIEIASMAGISTVGSYHNSGDGSYYLALYCYQNDYIEIISTDTGFVVCGQNFIEYMGGKISWDKISNPYGTPYTQNLPTNATLDRSYLGRTMNITGNGTTINLPSSASSSDGDTYTFVDLGAISCTIATDASIVYNGRSMTSMTFGGKIGICGITLSWNPSGAWMVKSHSVKESTSTIYPIQTDGYVRLKNASFFTLEVTYWPITLLMLDPSAECMQSIMIEITNGGLQTVTWPTGTKWVGGTPPTLTTAGQDVISMYTHDAGVTWNAFLVGTDSGILEITGAANTEKALRIANYTQSVSNVNQNYIKSESGKLTIGTQMNDSIHLVPSGTGRIYCKNETYITAGVHIQKASATEGGQINIYRGSDDTVDWIIDDQGSQASTSSANLRIIDRQSLVALQIEGTNRNVCVGNGSTVDARFSVWGTVTGAATAYGCNVAVNVDNNVVTSTAFLNQASSSVVGAGSLIQLINYHASQGNHTGTVQNQYGFLASVGLVGATNMNAGFHGAVGNGSAAITFVSLTSNVVTLEMASHSFLVGNRVQVSMVTTPSVNGTYTVTAKTATSISYALTAANIARIAESGGVAYNESRRNISMGGAANNYMAGNLLIGYTENRNAPGTVIGVTDYGRQNLQVNGTGYFSSNLFAGSLVLTQTPTGVIEMGNNVGGASYIDIKTDTTYTDFGLRIIRNAGTANAVSEIIARGTGGFGTTCSDGGAIWWKINTTEVCRLTSTYNLLVGSPTDRTTTNEKVQITGTLWAQNFATNRTGVAAATYTVLASDSVMYASVNTTLTLPAAAGANGRMLIIKNVGAFSVVSASANVIPQIGGVAVTAILPATAGKWAMIQSNGSNWEIMMSN
jgi:hypothetical protein